MNSLICLSDCSYGVGRGGNLVNDYKDCMPEGGRTEGQPLYSVGYSLCDERLFVSLEVYIFIRYLLLQI